MRPDAALRHLNVVIAKLRGPDSGPLVEELPPEELQRLLRTHGGLTPDVIAPGWYEWKTGTEWPG